jgi:seryl-tRNA synthetase
MVEKMSLEGLTKLVNEIVNKIGLLNDRMRLIEERSHQNREKIRVVEENLVIKFKDLREDVKRLNLEVDDLRKNSSDLTKTIQRIIRDLSKTAKLSDVNVIEKVIEFFDPTRYLTEKDINRIISERVK